VPISIFVPYQARRGGVVERRVWCFRYKFSLDYFSSTVLYSAMF